MQFHKSPPIYGADCRTYHKFYVLASSHRAQWEADNTNPIEKFRLLVKRGNAADVVVGVHSETFGLALNWGTEDNGPA